MRLTLLLTLASSAVAVAAPVDYVRDVKPILQERCYHCHGTLKQKAKLRLDSGKLIHKGGSSGPALVPGKSGESLLIEKVIDADEKSRMPPELKPLTAAQISTLKAWIDQGAKFPADDKPEADPRDHWAFRPPVRPAVPSVEWGQNPIDAFLAAEWKKHNLAPQKPVEKRLLLRRVYLDLIGLPPTQARIDAFLKDQSAEAYEKVVNQLLESPQYGERWGRHFMDIWRYSDWWGLGAEVRNSQKHIWHWRDWIIESLNADKGYDQMIREMLAADELYPNDPDKLRASGYLARQYFIFNRTTWMDETVEHTAKAFLGLTMNCCKCHDHKYDPIAQTDYYRFQAFFEPYQVRMDMVPGTSDFEKDGIPRAFDCNLDAITYKFERGDDRKPIESLKITPGLPAVFGGDLKITPLTLPAEAYAPQLHPFVEANYVKAANTRIALAREAVRKAEAAVAASEKEPKPAPRSVSPEQAKLALAAAEKGLALAEAEVPAIHARFAAERAKYAQAAAANELAKVAAKAEKQIALLTAEENLAKSELELLQAGTPRKPAAKKNRDAAKTAVVAATKALENPGDKYPVPRGAMKTKENNLEAEPSLSKPFPTMSTGRRSALANWITDRQNPLAARVAVNDIWMRHFGKPLVATVFDFGRKGTKPTHPELLDWLAVELMEHHWSLKHLHRLMVTSEAYRLSSSSAGLETTNAADIENRYYWRMNPLRMDSEEIRDGLLQLADLLDPTQGGPSIDVNADSKRRSLYYVHSHNDHQMFLKQFDDAGVLECYRRTESIVPQQALTLANSKFSLTMADAIAARIATQRTADGEYVGAAFELILGSTPSAEEMRTCMDALSEWKAILTEQKHANPTAKARANLVAALLNHNDFVTIR